MSLRPNDLIIHDGNAHLFVADEVDGVPVGRGLVPRDLNANPPGCYASAPAAVNFTLIPRAEWPERIRDKVANKSQLSDIRLVGNNGGVIPSLDQNPYPYCWAHSSVTAVMMLRAVANLPYVPLSAFAVACIIKNYRQEGGWGAQSLDFITERGVPSQEYWAQKSMSRSNDRPETWANAILHKVTEGWIDLSASQYDRNLSFEQEISCYLSDVPVVKDESWWSHSICGLDAVDGSSARNETRAESGKIADLAAFERMWGMNDPVTGGIGVRILNSWSDTWGDRGMSVLTGQKAVSDGSVAPRVTGAAAA